MLFVELIFLFSIILLGYVFFIYPFVLLLISLIHRKPLIKDDSEKNLPSISLIIAAYNEEKFIERKIQNCLSLDYPDNKIEIIIGSDGSDDATNSIVKKYVTKGIFFFSHPIRLGKMAVVNDAVKHAKGEICVFSDVSELFECDAMKKLVRNFVDPTIGAVTGNHIYNPSDTGLSKWSHLYWRYQRWLQRIESNVSSIMSCDGTIYACRRTLFVPPPMGTINDDKAVPLGILRQGYRVIFEQEAIAYGDVLPESKAFFRQKIRGQAGMYQIFWQFKDMFLPKKSLEWLIFISHSVGPVMVPWLLLVLFISNAVLSTHFPYSIFFFLQIIFYSIAVFGGIAPRLGLKVFFLQVPYFFCLSNIASLVGFFTYLFKSANYKWTKVE